MSDLSERIANLTPEQRAVLAQRLERAKRVPEDSPAPAAQPIAVIGMGCRFPGGARNSDAYWEMLRQGVDAITPVPAGRWDSNALFDPDPAASGKSATRWGAYLDQVDQFDAAFFGISPGEAKHMDPQQRMLMEVSWNALEDAGQTSERLAGSNTGVFIGIINHSSEYYSLQASALDSLDIYSCTGTAHSVMANRLSYFLDLRGPSMAIDTACSSSLVAVHQAVMSLRTRECDLALAGGVHLLLNPENAVMLSRLSMMAPDGHCKTFDARADGFVRGEGGGVVVLKRLSDALAAGDKIIAVVRGSAINQDGKSNGLTAPNGPSQSALIRQALKDGGLSPSQVTYVETHGTGTALGDPIEVEALTEVIGQPRASGEHCYLGSVKTNIGHLEGAAGIAGFMRAVLCLRNKWIPPHLNFQRLNPHIHLENTPFVISTSGGPWPEGRNKRCAAVSSFGVGGANAHLILEEAEPAPEAPAAGPAVSQLLTLSARSPESLQALASAYRDFLSSNESAPLRDVCFTASVKRSHHEHRLAVTGSSAPEIRQGLTAFLEGKVQGFASAHVAQNRRRGMVFVFSGQGPQWFAMGRELLRDEPVFRETMERCDQAFRQLGAWSLLEELAAEESRSRLGQTEFAQPAIFALQIALAAQFASWGVAPDAVVGHSVGEVAAAYVAGALPFEDAVRVIFERGRVMDSPQGYGKMAQFELPQAEVEPHLSGFLGRLSIAAVNSPTTTVVSGEAAAMDEFLDDLKTRGVSARVLPVKYAFHSPRMDSFQGELVKALQGIAPRESSLPIASSVTGTIWNGAGLDAAYWWSNVRQPVVFATAVERLLEAGYEVFLEVSPHPVLSSSISQSLDRHETTGAAVPTLVRKHSERASLLTALGNLYVNGCDPDWTKLYSGEAHFLKLPLYPWRHKRYWIDTPATPAQNSDLPQLLPSTPAPFPGQNPGLDALDEAPDEAMNKEPLMQNRRDTIPPLSRKDRLLPLLLALLQEVSGLDLTAIQPDVSFMDLGLDSLLLTQTSQALLKKFGVKISIRQLMEDLSTPDAVAAFLADKVGPSVLPDLPTAPLAAVPAAIAPPAYAPAPAAVATTTASHVAAIPGDASLVERVVREQLAIMTQQLDLLRGSAPAPRPASAPKPQPAASNASNPVPAAAPSPAPMAAHGPFKPIAKGSTAGVTAQQQKSLDALIERYVQRTRESKRLTALHREYLADPRSVSGFKLLWKEMVYPFVTPRSDGSKVWDVDGNEYVDFVMGFGASLFGHRPPFVTKAVQEQTQAGFEIGPISPLAGEVAALMREFTGQERFGFTNTGTEAVLAAVRVARTVTGRDKIAVFAGAYHGIGDEMLFRPLTVNGETRTAPIAPGIPDSAVSQVIVLDYCNPQSLEIIRARGSEIAAVLVETVQSRRLDLQPEGFLQELRKVTDETGSALIFDEVVWGFRLNPGGAAAHFGVRPDLATYGKVVGGGLPIGIVGGCAKYMDALDGGPWQYGDSSFPEVGVTFFAGTFVRHPLALAAAKAVLTHLKQAGPDLQRRLSERTAETARKMRAIIEEFHAPYHLSQFSSLMHLSYPQEDRFASLLYYYLRERGIHIWDNRAFVLTTAHTDQDLAKLCRALRESLAEMRTAGFLPPAPDSPDSKTPEATSKAPAPASPVPTSGVPSLVSAPSASAAPGPAGSFPLTEAQKEIWLAAQMGGDASVAYNESLSLDFHGPFDADVFRAAVREVVQRHPILLARIDADGESQHIDPGTELELPLLDFRDRDQAGRERELAALVDREISTPFDLAKGPFLRVHVARLTPEHHAAVWTAHHIVCDGWSLGVLMNELGTVYSARKQGLQPVLPVPVSFRQFAIESGADSTEAQEAVAYWKRQFAEVPLPLDLPTDRPRPSFRSAQASTRKRVFDAALYQSLKRTASQQRTTLVVLLMAGLDTLLHRLTGQTDVVLGLGVAGQAVSGNNSLVGHCLNTLPVRARLEPDASFQHNLAAIRGAVLDAYEHHQCTIGGLLQHLQVPRSAGRPPLIEVLFNVDRDPAAGEFLGAKFTCDRNAKRALHFDLFFNFVESAQGLYLECDYNTDLFDASTMDRWMAHYRTLLESIARNPAETLAQLAILTPAEQQGLLADPNRTDADFPEHRTLPEWFQSQASRSPDARAVAYEGIDLTYAGLNGRANQVAHHLREMGVGPDVLVGVCLERSLDMVVALLGILKAGGAYVPLDPAFPQDRLGYMVEDSRMPVLITHRDLDRMLPVRPERIVRLDADWPEIAARASGSGPWHSPGPEHLAYVLYTSGSTGKPKGVEIPHRALVNFLASMQRQPGFTSADRLLAVTTLSFDIAGLELYLPLVSGGSVFVASTEDAHDPIRLMERMREARCNVMQATPATWRALIDAGWSGAPDLKILCGGEAFPRDLAQELLHRSKEVWNMYGPTETTIWSTLHKVTSASGAIPIGHPIANTQVVLLDAHRNLVPPGAIGELCIGGAGLARGYLRRPELTEDRFIASPFHDHARLYRTGDLARWLPGNIIECLGRVDNQVKVRGFRIELGEIETVLAAHEAIRQCVVVAREDRPGDKVLVAYFEPRDEHPAAAADLRAHLKKDLPEYMVPSLFVPLDKLPLTPNGKIDRKALPAPASENLETSGEFLAPEDSLEQMLAHIFSKILRVKRVGRRDNFFELGGHSLAAVRLLSDVRKATGKNLPLATLFQASSVEALANILRQDGWQPSWSSVVPMRVTGSRPPLFLIHGAEGNVLLYEQLVRNLGPDQPVYGLQSQGLNGEAPVHSTIQEMAARYREEILTVQPQGPYHLGGYCLGGTIAFEMAQQLIAAGHEVGLVALLDTYNEGAVSYPSVRLQMPLHVVQNLWYHGVNFFNAPAPDRGKFLRQKIDIAVDRSRIRLCAVGHALLRLTGRETPAELPHLRIKRANDQASMEYRPQPYRGRVAVFRPRGFFAGLASPSLGWEGVVTSGLEIHELPVYPKGMLIEPFCRSLAQAIASCLSHGDGGDSQAPPANGNGLHRERPESTLVS